VSGSAISLYQRMLLFPLSYFQKNSSAQIIPMIRQSAIHWAGSSRSPSNTPRLQGGQLLTNIFFMFMQAPILGFACGGALSGAGLCDPGKLQKR